MKEAKRLWQVSLSLFLFLEENYNPSMFGIILGGIARKMMIMKMDENQFFCQDAAFHPFGGTGVHSLIIFLEIFTSV